METQRIDCLKTDTVQAHALLESLAVELTAGVEHAHRLDQFALRNSASVVTYHNLARIGQIYLDTLAGIHAELIHAVVDNLLEQYVDSVIGCRTVAQLAYIHTRTRTDMLHIVHVADVVLIILHLRCLRIK